MKGAATCVFSLALLLPTPAAKGRHIRMAMCSGGTALITIPLDPQEDDKRACCRKACHAGDSRRKRPEPGVCCA